MTKELIKFNDTYNGIITGWYLTIIGAVMCVVAIIGKKITDFIYDAIIEKFEAVIRKIVKEENESIQDKIEAYKTIHHGVIQKNEGVLLQALDALEKYNEKKK